MKRRRGAWLLVLVIAFATGSPDRAVAGEDEAARAHARGLVAQGRGLYEKGDYAGALDRFQTAWKAFPSPKIRYNLGQAYRGLARDVEALEAFEAFLATAADATPDSRARAQEYVAELRARVATVEVTSDVEGAEVSIDGRPRGVTPLPGALTIAPGPHQLVVQKAGLPPWMQRVEPSAGERLRIAALVLAPPPAIASPAVPASVMAVPAPATAGGGEGRSSRRFWLLAGGIVLALGAGAAAAYFATRPPDPIRGTSDPGVVVIR